MYVTFALPLEEKILCSALYGLIHHHYRHGNSDIRVMLIWLLNVRRGKNTLTQEKEGQKTIPCQEQLHYMAL